MPSDNKEAYKEMYDMGQRLMQMAADGGYNPDEEMEEDYESTEGDETTSQETSGGYSGNNKDKVNTALNMFSNG